MSRKLVIKPAQPTKLEKAYARAWIEAHRWAQYCDTRAPHNDMAPAMVWGFMFFCLAVVCLGMLSEVRGCS